jgi:hypothetical protein
MMRTWHENIAVDQVKSPGNLASETVPAAYIDMSDWARIVFEIKVGTMDVTSTIDAQVVQATLSDGTGSKNISGAAITQLVAADDDVLVTIEVRDTALDVENDFRFVALTVAVAGTAVVGTITAYRYKGGGQPPTQPAFYAEQVEVA